MEPQRKILVIDDDESILSSVCLDLLHNNYDSLSAQNGKEGLELFHSFNPDYILLDLELPDIHGFDLLKEIRKTSDLPLLVISGHHQNENILNSLNYGADYFIKKPFKINNIIDAIDSVDSRKNKITETDKFRTGNLEFDIRSHILKINGANVHLTKNEYNLLKLFIEHPNELLEFEFILKNIWGGSYIDEHEYVKILVRSLRKKIESNPSNPEIIINDRGIGYIFIKK